MEMIQMVNVEECRSALYSLLSGKYSLHIPPQKNDVDVLLMTALDELEKLQTKEEIK
jgi:hypothetical protein